MYNKLRIKYYKLKLSKLIYKYEKERDESMNVEFQRVCKILQEIDPEAPSVPPPHISEMVDFPIIMF